MNLPLPILTALAADLGLERAIRIADVGANPLGEHIYQPLIDAGLCEVIGFEPNDEAFAALETHQSDRARYLNLAVGDGQPVDFHAYQGTGMSSVFPLRPQSLGYLKLFRHYVGTEEVTRLDTKPLDEIDDVPPLDFLKMDTQGSELSILQSGRSKLSTAVAVVTEMRFYQLYENEPAMGELDLELRKQGFVLHRFLFQKSRMLKHSQKDRVLPRRLSSQLIDGDAVYIRSLEDPNAWGDDQLKILALLAHTVFQSYDLVLVCLDHLAARKAVHRDAASAYADRLPDVFHQEEA